MQRPTPTFFLLALLAMTATPTSATLSHLPKSLVEGFRSLSAHIDSFSNIGDDDDDMDTTTIILEKDISITPPTIESFVSPDIVIQSHEDKIEEGVSILRSLGDKKQDEEALIKLLLTEDDLAFEEGLAMLKAKEEVQENVPSSEEGASGRVLGEEGVIAEISEDIADQVESVDEEIDDLVEEGEALKEDTEETLDEVTDPVDEVTDAAEEIAIEEEGLIRNLDEDASEETSDIEEIPEEGEIIDEEIPEEGDIIDEEIPEEEVTEDASEDATTTTEAPSDETTIPTITEEPSDETTTTEETSEETTTISGETTIITEEPSEETTIPPTADDRSITIEDESSGLSGFISGLFG